VNAARDIPGGLWIALLFSPWIAYWIICGFGYSLGVLVGLFISIIIYVVSPDKRSIMGLTTLIYFVVGVIFTFALRLPLFVTHNGPLGYGALCIMSLASLAFKNPYTYEVAKRDYPEAYWHTPEFFRINAILTSVWTVIFLVNALLHLQLPPPYYLVSIALNILGIVISVVYPRMYLRWSVQKLIPAYARWKAPDSRDVIIVGSGIGGLTCGALLAKRGYRVTVLEHHYQVGGCCTSFRRGHFIFSAGVESISGLGPRGPVRHLLVELGYNPDELFVRTREAYVIGGEWIEIPSSFNEFVEMLCKRYPDEAEAIREFFSEVETVYREMYKEVELVGAPLPKDLLAQVLGIDYLFRYPVEHPAFSKYIASNPTLKEVLDQYFRNEELKKLLVLLTTAYLGTPPEETPFLSALPIYGYYIDGGYYPKGSAQAYANLLARIIENNRGRVLLRHMVEKVVVEDGAVRGVIANGRFFEAPIVVLNVNALNLLKLVDKRHLPKSYIEHIESLRPSVTAFIVYLGVKMDLSGYPPLIKSFDDGIGIVVNSNLDPELAPKGHSSVSIITLLPPEAYKEFGRYGTPDYKARKAEYTNKLIKKAERLIPGLKDNIVIKDAATPYTIERYTLNPNGAIYGLDQSARAPKRPYYKTPIKGLYLTGASTFPGGGIEAVTISGIITANDISSWPTRQKEK